MDALDQFQNNSEPMAMKNKQENSPQQPSALFIV
jgi:hypothetical protein